MASIQKRSNGQWRARYRDPSGRERARHFDRKVDAQRWLDEQAAAMVTGQWVNPKAGKVTFGDYARAWQAAQMHRRNTALAVDSALRIHALPVFGDRPISSIRRSEIQTFVKALGERLAPSSVATAYQHMRPVFRAAEFDRVIASSPCQRIVLPRRERQQVEPLATETVLSIAGAMPDRLAAMVTVMAGTGLRPGEAAGVTLDRVDFLRRTLRVDRQLLQTRPPSFGPPKTQAGRRTVPLPQVVVEALAAHVAAFPPGEHGLIFCQRDGRPLNRDKVVLAFRKVAPDGTRLHDLRHYYASLLIRHGESVKVVQGEARPCERKGDAGHVQPPVARLRGYDPSGCGRCARADANDLRSSHSSTQRQRLPRTKK
jgi:integrase